MNILNIVWGYKNVHLCTFKLEGSKTYLTRSQNMFTFNFKEYCLIILCIGCNDFYSHKQCMRIELFHILIKIWLLSLEKFSYYVMQPCIFLFFSNNQGVWAPFKYSLNTRFFSLVLFYYFCCFIWSSFQVTFNPTILSPDDII